MNIRHLIKNNNKKKSPKNYYLYTKIHCKTNKIIIFRFILHARKNDHAPFSPCSNPTVTFGGYVILEVT